MSMFEPGPPRPAPSQVARSQLALELALNAYALAGVAILLRFLFLALEIDRRLWIGAATYRFTDPVVWPLTLLPGADRRLIGAVTLPDLTLVAGLLLVPLALLAYRRRLPG